MELAFISLNSWQIIALIVLGVLLFGSRLPSIARSLGKSVVEFKKGVKDIKDEVESDEPRRLEDKSSEAKSGTVEKKEAEKVSN
jgi:TatA/E family protein of Tat protein translocase